MIHGFRPFVDLFFGLLISRLTIQPFLSSGADKVFAFEDDEARTFANAFKESETEALMTAMEEVPKDHQCSISIL
jgi:hypothetical protein